MRKLFFGAKELETRIDTRVPNQRSKGQKLVNVPMHEDFLEALDRAVVASGLGDRSKFIRSAILEKATKIGVTIPQEHVGGPPRYGREKPQKRQTTTKGPKPPVVPTRGLAKN